MSTQVIAERKMKVQKRVPTVWFEVCYDAISFSMLELNLQFHISINCTLPISFSMLELNTKLIG